MDVVKTETLPCVQQDAASMLKFIAQSLKTTNEIVSAILEGSRNGTPVIFIHGNSSTKTVWSYQIAAVREHGCAVLATDLPGHGDSENAQEPGACYSIPGYANVIRRLCDTLNWGAANVVGWSLRAHIGLELLADTRVRSLLIVGAPPIQVRPEAIAEAFHQTEVAALAGKSDLSEHEANLFAATILGGSHMVTREHLDAVKRTHGIVRAMLYESIFRSIGADERQAAETIEKRLCIVVGEKDPFIRLDYLRSLSYRALWRNRIFVIAGAGHAPHWECPKSFNTILLEFLNEDSAE
jgi:pimeloyl-ACP methyl ester carboxylesterase